MQPVISRTTDPDAIQALILGRTFVLTFPRFKSHNAHLAYFLAPGNNVYYVKAWDADTTLGAFVTHLVEAFHEIDESFNSRVEVRAQKPAERAQRLAKDIAKTAPQFIVLDELDRLSALGDELFTFLQALGEGLPASTQLVLNARDFNYAQWQPLLENGRAVILGDLDEANQALQSSVQSPQVEVYGFGGGLVFTDGLPVTVWDGPLPRNLFYYFVDHPLITRTEIFSTFWPDLPAKEATNVFHVTKRKVSERVGYETMGYSGGFYRASKRVEVYYDVALFEAAIDEGRLNPDNTDAWMRAIKLYRQPFLHRLHMPWMNVRRQKLAQDYTEALISMARHFRQDDVALSASYYLRALREMPHREDVHRDVMTLYAEQGNTAALAAQYRSLETELKRAFNITPGKATRELYASLTSKRH